MTKKRNFIQNITEKKEEEGKRQIVHDLSFQFLPPLSVVTVDNTASVYVWKTKTADVCVCVCVRLYAEERKRYRKKNIDKQM